MVNFQIQVELKHHAGSGEEQYVLSLLCRFEKQIAQFDCWSLKGYIVDGTESYQQLAK